MGEKIYKVRRAKGLSQEKLSELVGVSRQTISQWENDKFQPSSDNIDVLCRVLCVSREELLGETASVPRPKKVMPIVVCSVLTALMAFVTAMLGCIVFTDNTGDMMDNSYSIPKDAFYLSLAATLIILVVGIVVIVKEKLRSR